MNRLFINFLISVKMYQDQVPSHIRNCLINDQNAINNSKDLFSKEFDSFIEYRFMEALRNHAQHGGQSVHGISFQKSNIGSGDSARNQLSISIWALKPSLMENPKFTKRLLSSVDEKIDLIRFSRKYIQCINNCHMQMREMISHVIDNERRDIESIQSDFMKSCHGTLDNTYLIRTDEQGKEIGERIPLFLQYDDERIALIDKNRSLNNLPMACFASTSYPS